MIAVFLIHALATQLELSCKLGGKKQTLSSDGKLQDLINIMNSIEGHICTISPTDNNKYTILDSSIEFKTGNVPAKLIFKGNLDTNAVWLRIRNKDITVELTANINLYLYRSITKLNELVGDGNYLNMASLLAIYQNSRRQIKIDYDGPIPFSFIFPATISPAMYSDKIKPDIRININGDYSFSTDTNYDLNYVYYNGYTNISDNYKIMIQKGTSADKYYGHDLRSTIWLIETFKGGIANNEIYYISPYSNKDIAINERFIIGNLPKLFSFTPDSSGQCRISGTLEITNPGIRYGGKTNGMNLIIYSNGDILNAAADDKSIVPIIFDSDSNFLDIKVFYQNIGDREKLYVGSYQNSAPSTAFSVYVDGYGNHWTEQTTENQDSLSYIVFNKPYPITITALSTSSSEFIGKGSNIMEAVNKIKQQTSLDGMTITITPNGELNLVESITFGHPLPAKVIFALDANQNGITGEIEFTEPGVIVSGMAPKATITLHMTKAKIQELGEKNAYLIDIDHDSPFMLVKAYFEDISDLFKVYLAKITGSVSVSFNLYIDNNLINADAQRENDLLYFDVPPLKFTMYDDSDGTIKEKCDTIDKCIANLGDKLSGKTFVIQANNGGQAIPTIEFIIGKVPNELIFMEDSNGWMYGQCEIVTKGVKVKGSGSTLKLIMHVDTSLGSVNDPKTTYIIELENYTSFESINFVFDNEKYIYSGIFLIKTPSSVEIISSDSFILTYNDQKYTNPVIESKTIDGDKYYSLSKQGFNGPEDNQGNVGSPSNNSAIIGGVVGAIIVVIIVVVVVFILRKSCQNKEESTNETRDDTYQI